MSDYLIVNFDRKEYLRPQAFGQKPELENILASYDGVLTALAVLLSDGNGRGGGDLRSSSPIIGTWAGHRLALVDDLVCDEHLSEPGLQDIPLLAQMLKLGKDVSAPALQAIVEGEGDYSVLSTLNPQLLLSLPAQRALGPEALAFLRDAKARSTAPMTNLDHFFGVLGVPVALTPSRMAQQLQKGLQHMAQELNRPERHEVQALEATWRGTPWGASSTCHIRAQITDSAQPGALAVSLSVQVGPNGDSVQAFFEQVFGGLMWEQSAPALAVSERSPFVAKLLQTIQQRQPGLES